MAIRVGDVVLVPCPEDEYLECGRRWGPELARVMDRRSGGLLTVQDDDGVRWCVPCEDVIRVVACRGKGVGCGQA